jgi:hypothetical protein
LWKEFARAGLLSLALPGWLDGDDLGIGEIAAVLTEVGRTGAGIPAFATLALGVLPVVRWADRALAEKVLAGVGTGGTILTAALREPSDPMPAAPATVITGNEVTGTKVGVQYAAEASWILVPVSVQDGGTTVVVIDPADPTVSVTRTHTAGGDPEHTVRMESTPVLGMLSDGPDGGNTVGGIYELGIAGACAIADGAVAGAFALTREHIVTRHQFGRPLATFQAAAQHIADVYIDARTLHLAVTSAVWRLAEGLTQLSGEAQLPGEYMDGSDLDVAAYWLASRAPEALLTCHHLHGGMGMDVTYPLPRLSGLVKDLVRFVGGADYRLDQLAGRS